ncbi:SRPBCC domain-containing protein [Paeniglutamicibacter sp. ABSL32-1]|uniref:SRPBCC domain-containing protein n=1 Tax=Paeniglutamicibacter quisquiliarum TaxID=2849498 RepID=UPI001C2D8857|nr:SRPBCC domain-containing protein [Paeniglutamicibacter quisquiliarum]MBV1778800.1 SRPBCC domain-containing protein [Paeniglutamicibacter quisquiliarum]
MDGLFSHAASANEPGSQDDYRLPERRHTVDVPVSADQAFEGFSEYIHLWWPVNKFSHFGPGSHVTFDQGSLLEESEDGELHLWGKVVHLDAPHTIVLDFTLGMETAPPTHVSLDFRERGTGADLVLIHDGWSAGYVGQEQYEHYTQWPEILDYYARFMGANSQLDR